jgi:hypothetical protein
MMTTAMMRQQQTMRDGQQGQRDAVLYGKEQGPGDIDNISWAVGKFLLFFFSKLRHCFCLLLGPKIMK